MNCCCECFSSAHLKAIINSNDRSGNCDFCNSVNVNVYDPRELSLTFQNILDLYTISEKGRPIEEQIEVDFPGRIFTDKVRHNSKILLQEIVTYDYEPYEDLFNNNVENVARSIQKQELVKPFELTWEKLTDEIKNTNRFHLQNRLPLEKLGSLLERYSKKLHRGKIFYRARISGPEGFPIDKMGNPPKDQARAGRANPVGISYLYLSDSEITTLYETRASLYDYVTIGTFRLKEDVIVINLRSNTYDPVFLADREHLEDFLTYRPFTSKLERQLSKPKRRNDNELDYLPTQYLSEFIKSIKLEENQNCSGIEFQSSLYEPGYNLAIFYPDMFECTDVKVYEIKKIDISHEPIP